MKNRWQLYDPTWLVELASTREPKEIWLADALSHCTLARQESSAYIHFVDPARANQPRGRWQIRENIIFEHSDEGDIVLDILQDGTVGGIEFLARIQAKR